MSLQAFLRMYYPEKACDIQLAARAGGELNDPDGYDLAWTALLHMLDRVSPGYRD